MATSGAVATTVIDWGQFPVDKRLCYVYVDFKPDGTPLTESHKKALQNTHTGHKWVVNIHTGETRQRRCDEVASLVSSGEWKLGRKM